MRGSRYLTRDQAIAIFLAPGMGKNIAADFDVSPTTVSWIKNGKRWGDVTSAWSQAAAVNASLVSAAFGVTHAYPVITHDR